MGGLFVSVKLLTCGSSGRDLFEGLDELAVLLGRADTDTDSRACSPASGKRSDDYAVHLQTSAKSGSVFSGFDVDEIAPAFNRRVA